MPLLFTLIIILALLSAVAFSSLGSVHAIIVNNTKFSVNVLDNWAYMQPNPIAQALGGSYLDLVPIEFNEFLVNTSREISGKTIQNGGAYSILSLDTQYPYRNVPLQIYTQYSNNISKVKIFSIQNTTVDGEPAVKVHRGPRNNFTNVEVIEYYIVHKGNPYTLQFAANVKDFQRYLPQFEQMVKTLKFTK
jgi:hypothetical protein